MKNKVKSPAKKKEVIKKPDIISFDIKMNNIISFDIKMNINYKESSSITLYFYSNNYGNAYLANLKTPVEMRKKGNATRLIDAAEKLAKSMGAQFILCWCNKNEIWKRNWYYKLGYLYLHNDLSDSQIWLKKDL